VAQFKFAVYVSENHPIFVLGKHTFGVNINDSSAKEDKTYCNTLSALSQESICPSLGKS
jgi:hypothetical protein